MKKLLFLLVATLVPCYGADWSLKGADEGWNSSELVTLYFHNSEMQTQWAWNSLSHYSFQGNETVLDFGSGDGKITAMLSYMVPKGSVRGVDLSEEMVEYASKMFPESQYPNLTFSTSPNTDFSGINTGQKYALITSFCVFHVVPQPVATLTNLREKITPDGTLIMTWPVQSTPDFYRAAKEEMEKRGWDFPSPTAESKRMRREEEIPKVLAEAGFDVESLRVFETRMAYSSRKELVDWLEGTLSGNWNIPADRRRDFFEKVATRYLQYRPRDVGEEGFVYFTFLKRAHLIAKPKTEE